MIFTRSEMERRMRFLQRALADRDLDLALVHTADSAFYFSGTPLLDEWGRPMWVLVRRDGSATILGSYIELGNMRRHTWIDDVRAYDDARPSLETCLRITIEFAKSAGPAPRRLGVERGVMSLAMCDAIRGELPEAELVDISDVIAGARIIKSEEELRVLRLAAEVAKIGADAFVDAIKPGVTEMAVASSAISAMDRALGALDGEAITSSYSYCQVGDHSMTPHLHPTGRRIRPGDVIGLNVFPVVWGYCIELERTLVLGEPNADQRRALDAVNEAFEAIKADYRPGALFCDLDLKARDILGRRGYADNIWHGTGHAHGIMIGATAREELGEIRAYNTSAVAVGMVNSIEPGIFIDGVGAFRHSDVLIATEGGSEVITDFPRDIPL
jgi:Xaa-Pro aminopeptidase